MTELEELKRRVEELEAQLNELLAAAPEHEVLIEDDDDDFEDFKVGGSR